MPYHQAGEGAQDWKVPFIPSLTKYSWGQDYFMYNTNKYVDLVQVGNSGSDKGIATLYLAAFKKHMTYVLSYWHGINQCYIYTVYTVLLFTYSCLNWGWDGYNEINIIIADGLNLFPLEVFDGRKCLALVLWQIFSSSQGVRPLILMYHTYIHISFIYTCIIHIYIYSVNTEAWANASRLKGLNPNRLNFIQLYNVQTQGVKFS